MQKYVVVVEVVVNVVVACIVLLPRQHSGTLHRLGFDQSTAASLVADSTAFNYYYCSLCIVLLFVPPAPCMAFGVMPAF